MSKVEFITSVLSFRVLLFKDLKKKGPKPTYQTAYYYLHSRENDDDDDEGDNKRPNQHAIGRASVDRYASRINNYFEYCSEEE